ncbi:hypothetical protein L873DRAFT_862030 [Choiromyces venosus 120613-1]|uniref:Uncharacterized protein n=1 Tax=Choiromyces venosus 120613-1 TaxID=1336337 RepID=A0A3N4JRH6_9PEZI|nr:hypothetical protein L873DRAFT_862030 [Choiromyces venosus 120613-1]
MIAESFLTICIAATLAKKVPSPWISPHQRALLRSGPLCPRRPSSTISDPKRPVHPALGTAGLTQAFSGMAGPGCGKATFQNQSRARPGSPAGFVCG